MVVNIDKFIDESEASSLGGGFAVGPISWSPEVVQDISGPPAAGTLPASSITTHDHPHLSTSGLKFEFAVPEDYDSGAITLQAVYAMSTAVASPNNVIVLNVGAEIADTVSGGIDTGTYAPGPLALVTPDNLTDVERSANLLTIAEGDFASGDKIVFLIERLGGDGSDNHTGSWKLVDYLVIYNGQVAARAAMHQVEVYADTDETAATPGTKSSFDTLDFPTGADTEQVFQFTVPDNWDGASDLQVRLTYAMSTAGGGPLRLETEGEIANTATGAVVPYAASPFILTAPADTDVHRTTVVRAIAGTLLNAGDAISVKLARRGTSLDDTHGGDFKLIASTVFIGQGGTTPVGTEFDESYLDHRDFRIISVTGVNGQQESADHAGEFELWALMDSTVAAGRVNAEWQGRLRATQTQITQIIIPLRGQSGGPTPQYQIKVFVEGSGASNVYTGSALTPETTGNRIVVTLTDSDLSAQPTGEKRFFVVVEAHLDAGEELRVGTPFVRQE